MKWTDQSIQQNILSLMEVLEIKTMPTNTQMRNNKMSGLSRAIGMSGGVYHWSEKLGIPRARSRRKWTDELIREKIKKSMVILCIKRMPTASELTSIGRNDLHCAISKYGTYRAWADRLDLEMKSSETSKGHKYEQYIKDILVNKGHEVAEMTTGHPYDLLVSENLKVDVKVGVAHNHFGSRAHTFRPSSKNSTCDIYICVALDETSETENIFIIPSKFARVQTINIGANSKYDKFINRWDFVENYTKFYDSVVI